MMDSELSLRGVCDAAIWVKQKIASPSLAMAPPRSKLLGCLTLIDILMIGLKE